MLDCCEHQTHQSTFFVCVLICISLHLTGNTWTAEQEATFKQPILTKYEKESHAFYSSARLWDDGIIDPADTRKVNTALQLPYVTRFIMCCWCGLELLNNSLICYVSFC